jgi:two-component system sensor histidine kinase YesM
MHINNFRQRLLSIAELFMGSLTRKLVVVFSLVVSVFIVAIIYVSYNRTSAILKNDFIVNYKNVLRFDNENLDSYFEQIDDLSLILRKDDKFMNILLTQSEDYSSRTYVQDMIRNLFFTRADIEGLQFYINSSRTLNLISHSVPNLHVVESGDYTSQKWYANASSGKYYRDIVPGAEDGMGQAPGNVFFTFHRVYINISDARPICSISLSFNYKEINKLIKDSNSDEDGFFGIFDSSGKLFYANSPEFPVFAEKTELVSKTEDNAGTGNFTINADNKDYLVIYDISDVYKWKIVKLIPMDLVNVKAEQTRDLNIYIGLSCIVLLIITIVYISNAITGSLRRLTRKIDRVGSGNFDVQVEVRGNDEVAALSRKFNSMVIQIKELVNEEYKAKLSEKNARVKALEAQLNPHFLYNSLQAIASKAVLNGMKDVGRMIEALAHTFRYCVKGGNIVTISEEIQHIRNYLAIHKIRFEDRLSVEISIQEDIEDLLIPKLSIQTIVENSVKYALEQATESILIRISTYSEEEKCIIEISDNGPGMAPELLDAVRESLRDTNWLDSANDSIGLKNLNSRLKLMFGEDAGLIIESGANKGTNVKLILPIEKQGGDLVV